MQADDQAKPPEVATTIGVLQTCSNLLREHQHTMIGCLTASKQENEPPAIMLQRAFDFGIRTIQGICCLLNQDDGAKNSLLACTLCRPFYETSVRLLWAARTDTGWNRLQAYFAKQDRNWAIEATGIQSTAQIANVVLERANEILNRTDETGEKNSPAPDMKTLLMEIGKSDLEEGLREAPTDAAEFDYTNVYRWLCRPAHGHMVTIGEPSSMLNHAKCGVVMATWSLLKAWCHVSEHDPKGAIERIGSNILKLIQKGR